ncbi:T9SS type A sorting domain-containing protein [Flavobacterium sp. AS60]|uniref:T9SS type A sorting domain-containing protein n=1 Tax=Flavobacterium anseongense TaxID=2910677 RepID=UPI001F3E19D1|nr:T9SS type A sorting domain-containing protein [Flavobacterium sp. AS60]MCF6130045.1 T9SS type A sorting domain-containing protein [Flavobacterium sp. AS60]
MKKLFFAIVIFFYSNTSFSQCWKAVSAGYDQILAIANDGTLWSWGNNRYGELGIGTIVNSSTPVQVGTDNDWEAISAGQGPKTFNLAQKENGSLWSWGRNIAGQLGDGTFVDKLTPVPVGTDTDWISFSAGYGHAIAVKSNGTCWSWGESNLYALGNTVSYGGPFDRNVPAQVGTDTNWVKVSAGDAFSLALKSNGTIWGWGTDSGSPIGVTSPYSSIQYPTIRDTPNTGVASMSAGGTHSFDVKQTTSQIIPWGSNTYGQRGGTYCAGCPSYYVKSIDCGDDTTAIIKTDGTLWFCGKKLGYPNGLISPTTSFTQMGTASNWKMVSVGYSCGAALTNDNRIYTWGWNSYGQLGNGTSGLATSSESLVFVTCPSQLSQAQSNLDAFTIYPSPVENTLFIQNGQNLMIQSITVYDITGKTLLSSNYNFNSIDVSQLQKGIYILNINADSFSQRLKFIKN